MCDNYKIRYSKVIEPKIEDDSTKYWVLPNSLMKLMFIFDVYVFYYFR